MNNLKKIKLLLEKSVSISVEERNRFYKTAPGDYAEHDKFMGVRVPALRIIAKQFFDTHFFELQKLIESPINEQRLLVLFILVLRYKQSGSRVKEDVYQFYMRNLKFINNWNLVDASAHYIIGAHLFNKETKILFALAESKNMWERRISIVSTWYFIKKNKFSQTLKIALILLSDTHDLIHKAVGWMLREVGKQNKQELINFLDQYADVMPRTTLRYSIKRLGANQRKYYLSKKIN